MNFVRILLAVVSLTVSVGIFIFFSSRVSEASLFGAFEGGDGGNPIVTALIGFAITVVGVLLGSLHRRLLKLKEGGATTVKICLLFPHVLTSIDFMLGLVASPIVFGLLWQSLESLPMSGLVIICLQNGFACNSVLGDYIKENSEGN